MAKKEKFVYNIHTLKFERVQATLKAKLTKGFAIGSALVVYAAIVAYLSINFLPSPRIKMKDREIAQMKDQFNVMDKQVEDLKSYVNMLHARDNGIYRVLLEQNPISDGVWNAGTGGSDKYEAFKNLSEADLLQKTAEKISKLRRQIAIQAESHRKILEEFNKSEDRRLSIPSIKPVREDKLNKNMMLLSGFGYRIHPVTKQWKLHTGIDFGAPMGTPIYATGKGVIARTELKDSGYGHNIVISHGYGYETLYGHMSKFAVSVGQTVYKGQLIGYVGSTGTSTAPHCHYEVIKNGEKINPMHYCLDGLTPQEYQSFVENAQQKSASFDYGQ